MLLVLAFISLGEQDGDGGSSSSKSLSMKTWAFSIEERASLHAAGLS